MTSAPDDYDTIGTTDGRDSERRRTAGDGRGRPGTAARWRPQRRTLSELSPTSTWTPSTRRSNRFSFTRVAREMKTGYALRPPPRFLSPGNPRINPPPPPTHPIEHKGTDWTWTSPLPPTIISYCAPAVFLPRTPVTRAPRPKVPLATVVGSAWTNRDRAREVRVPAHWPVQSPPEREQCAWCTIDPTIRGESPGEGNRTTAFPNRSTGVGFPVGWEASTGHAPASRRPGGKSALAPSKRI